MNLKLDLIDFTKFVSLIIMLLDSIQTSIYKI